ncbi:MAG: hypothetical protein K2O70_04765 [Desulfovibrionaceae bacterium]|nr:hypothetical protein [Desulfovibrionaceae bacterium]
MTVCISPRLILLDRRNALRYKCLGAVLRKEGIPMKHFLRDVLAGFLASLLAALAAHLMNL